MTSLALDIGLILAGGVCAVVFALLLVQRAARPGQTPAPMTAEPLSLLFDHGILEHASSQAMTQLALLPGLHGWDDLRESVLARFPDFPGTAGGGEEGHITLSSNNPNRPEHAFIHWRGPHCWVELQADDPPKQAPEQAKELRHLRTMSDTCPNPAWQEDGQGKVIWHNQAYGSLQKLKPTDEDDHDQWLFDVPDQTLPHRVTFTTLHGDKPDTYEVKAIPKGDITAFHANCINAVVDAEDAQRSFVQTLAKTFAHLSVGLAIFNREGQLMLFNPALIDLTALPAQVLSTQPTMQAFFDQMREMRRMPEPKNYGSWRQDIADLITAATDGRYRETWTLETGQTYRVTARAHPDGATAFLIEDISAEVTVTRNFRAELEQAQTVFDTLEDGMAVFSASGVLTFCNTIYREMWQVDPENAFADVTIRDALRHWAEGRCDGQALRVVEALLVSQGPRDEARIDVSGGLVCAVSPLPQGATLVRFLKDNAQVAPPSPDAHVT